MRRPWVRFKAWSLMATVAILAVSLAAIRIDSAPGAAIAIIGSCVGCLAYKRYSEVAARRDAVGPTRRRWQKAGLVLVSLIIAAAVIGLSDLAFLVGYYSYLKVAYETIVMSHWTPYSDPGYMATGIIIGTAMAVWVGSCVRRTIWTIPGSPRRWLNLWPVAVVVLLALTLSLEEMRQRWRFCTMMAAYHAGPMARADGPRKAALHARLKRWYEKAALRPWLPIHPDRIPPGL